MSPLELPNITLDYRHVSVTFNYTVDECPSHEILMRIKAYLEAAYDDLTVWSVDVRKSSSGKSMSWLDGPFTVTFLLNSKDAHNG